MSFLCMTRNKEVSYHQCINECQYFFKSACIDKMNESYNQALEDLIEKIGNYTIVCNDGVTEIVEVKEIIRCKEQLIK